MKAILITEDIYNQLERIADNEGEPIEVMACMYLKRALGELDRLSEQIESLKGETEMNKAMLESRQILRRH